MFLQLSPHKQCWAIEERLKPKKNSSYKFCIYMFIRKADLDFTLNIIDLHCSKKIVGIPNSHS